MPTRTITKKKSAQLAPTKKFNPKVAGLLVSALFILGSAFALYSRAADPYEKVTIAPAAPPAAYTNLKKVKADSWHPCKGLYEVQGSLRDGEGHTVCTSGPDFVSENVTRKSALERRNNRVAKLQTKSSDETVAAAKARQAPIDTELVQSAIDNGESATAAQGGNLANALVGQIQTNPFQATAPKCFGDGQDGKRIVVIISSYARDPITKADEFTVGVAIRQMETQLIWSSSIQDANNVQHLRFLQNKGDCAPLIFTTTQTSGDQSFDSIVASTQTLQNSIRSYYPGGVKHFLIFTKSTKFAVCGTSAAKADGAYVGVETSAIIYGDCWNTTTPMHEFLHGAGAVDTDAPNADGGTHCLEGNDLMCYAQGVNNTGINGKPFYESCSDPNPTKNLIIFATLDCHGNDYFNVTSSSGAIFNPPATKGGVAKHIYNTANSGFMQPFAPPPPPPPANPAAK